MKTLLKTSPYQIIGNENKPTLKDVTSSKGQLSKEFDTKSKVSSAVTASTMHTSQLQASPQESKRSIHNVSVVTRSFISGNSFNDF
jgi:hypothetical protein